MKESSAFAAVFLNIVLSIACAPEGGDLRALADAEPFIISRCEDYRDKCIECVDVPESWSAACDYEYCVEYDLEYIDTEMPCFEEQREFSRCRLERLSCSEFYAMDIDTSPGSVCYPQILAAGECIAMESQ